MTFPLARSTALVTLLIIAGAPGVGIACGLACDLPSHHGGGEAHAHAHDADSPPAHHVGDRHAGHHGAGPARPAVASHHGCQHAPQGIQVVVQRAELRGIDAGRETASITVAADAPPAPRAFDGWTARPPPLPPPASASLRTTILRL